MQNGVKCIKKYRFYKYPVEVGQLFVQKPLFFLQNGDFQGGGGWEPTQRHTHALMVWGLGGWLFGGLGGGGGGGGEVGEGSN